MKYSISNINLRIKMSIVNVKTICVKKQKQTCQRPTQGQGARFFYNKNGRFYTSDGSFV